MPSSLALFLSVSVSNPDLVLTPLRILNELDHVGIPLGFERLTEEKSRDYVATLLACSKASNLAPEHPSIVLATELRAGLWPALFCQESETSVARIRRLQDGVFLVEVWTRPSVTDFTWTKTSASFDSTRTSLYPSADSLLRAIRDVFVTASGSSSPLARVASIEWLFPGSMAERGSSLPARSLFPLATPSASFDRFTQSSGHVEPSGVHLLPFSLADDTFSLGPDGLRLGQEMVVPDLSTVSLVLGQDFDGSRHPVTGFVWTTTMADLVASSGQRKVLLDPRVGLWLAPDFPWKNQVLTVSYQRTSRVTFLLASEVLVEPIGEPETLKAYGAAGDLAFESLVRSRTPTRKALGGSNVVTGEAYTGVWENAPLRAFRDTLVDEYQSKQRWAT